MENSYIDGISQIHFVNNMVRLDTFVLEPKQDAEPEQVRAGQIVMTPQGFLSALNAMQQLADRLVESGVFQKVSQ